MRKCLILIVVWFTLIPVYSAEPVLEVRITDTRVNNFYIDALVWLLDKSGQKYRLIRTDHPVSSQVRKVTLVLNDQIDVIYAGTTSELEQQLQAIRFPISRGLIGSRVFIINKQYQGDYKQVKSLADLRQYTGVISFGWAEKEIFQAAKLPLNEILYDDIFSGIDEGSRYYFPRGVLEAYPEILGRKDELKNLKVEDGLLLKYKSAVFFFINKNNTRLRQVLETGFKKGYQDGSYARFFYQHPLIKHSFEQASIHRRRIVEIPNPYFPARSRDIPELYWHQE